MPTKEYRVKPSLKARKAAKNMVENGGIVSKAMLAAGYSPATAKNPSKLTESKGFKQLADELGLTDEFITNALIDDIKNKPKNRSKELALAIKIKGLEKTSIDITNKTDSLEVDLELGHSFAGYLKSLRED